MSDQQSLFSASNLAITVEIAPAPKLIPHSDWPYPGMTPVESAQACDIDGYTAQAMRGLLSPIAKQLAQHAAALDATIAK